MLPNLRCSSWCPQDDKGVPSMETSKVHACSVLSDLILCNLMDCSPLGSSVYEFFSRQEYWPGLPFPPPEVLPDPGTKPTSPVSPSLAGRFFTTESPGKPNLICLQIKNITRLCLLQVKGMQNQFKSNASRRKYSNIFFSEIIAGIEK